MATYQCKHRNLNIQFFKRVTRQQPLDSTKLGGNDSTKPIPIIVLLETRKIDPRV